ncbi:MAG: envelope stress response membrane protein PspB [Hyphomonadaceae bacterium]|nr:envelope stress response membrane protein PspB [Hyphomonadaceae bacterium]
MEDVVLPIVIVSMLFIALPGMILHYVTEWRKMKSLRPDDERMLEDLWRSAKRMERRIEALETLIDAEGGAGRRPEGDDFTRRYDQ